MKIQIILTLFATALLLSFYTEGTAYAAEKVSLSDRQVALEVGSQYKLKVLNTDEEITWQTSDTSIAKVSSKGRITAKKAGSCKIYAFVGTKKLTCRVTVYNNYGAVSDKYAVSGFSTMMGRLPLKKFKYNDDTAYFKELSVLGSKCQVYFGLDAKGVDIVLDSDNYVYFIKNVKKYSEKYPDNSYLETLSLIADEAYENEAFFDSGDNKYYAIVQKESDLAAIRKTADNNDSVDQGFFFIFYPNKKATDFDCIVIGCDESSFDHITWHKL